MVITIACTIDTLPKVIEALKGAVDLKGINIVVQTVKEGV